MQYLFFLLTLFFLNYFYVKNIKFDLINVIIFNFILFILIGLVVNTTKKRLTEDEKEFSKICKKRQKYLIERTLNNKQNDNKKQI